MEIRKEKEEKAERAQRHSACQTSVFNPYLVLSPIRKDNCLQSALGENMFMQKKSHRNRKSERRKERVRQVMEVNRKHMY